MRKWKNEVNKFGMVLRFTEERNLNFAHLPMIYHTFSGTVFQATVGKTVIQKNIVNVLEDMEDMQKFNMEVLNKNSSEIHTV